MIATSQHVKFCPLCNFDSNLILPILPQILSILPQILPILPQILPILPQILSILPQILPILPQILSHRISEWTWPMEIAQELFQIKMRVF